MKKTSVFKKNITLKKVNFLKYDCEYRNFSDAAIANCLGINLTTLSSIRERIEDRKVDHAKFDKINKEKTFFPESVYLESFIQDLRSVPAEHRSRYAVIFDFETTGKFNSVAVSMAIELYDIEDEEVIETYYKEFNTDGVEIEAGAIAVHNITPEMVENAPTFKESFEEISDILSKGDFFVGQNLKFDLAVLERELERSDIPNKFNQVPVFDTMKAGRGVVPSFNKNGRIKDPTLAEQAVHFGYIDSIEDAVFHNAQVDVKFTRKIFQSLIEEF